MEFPHSFALLIANVLVWTAMVGMVFVWIEIVRRWWQHEPVLAVEPRRQVPWNGLDILMIFLAYFVGNIAMGMLAVALFGSGITDAPVIADPKATEASHLIVRLLSEGGLLTIVLAVGAAAVVAPITEEILFRLFLQGWLEKLDRRARCVAPLLLGWFRWGTLPVLFTSLLFAMVHFRGEVRQYESDCLLYLIVASSAIKLVTTAFALAVAVFFRGATCADLGWEPQRFLSDVVLGLSALLTVAVPIYVVQYVLIAILPTQLAPDPVPLFFFALVLGTLYLRTHRITPAIVAHMGLNSSSLLLVWATLK